MGDAKLYVDGEPVPPRARRCTAHMKLPNQAHPCKRVVDHDGDHKCICGKSWAKKAGV